ncbi:MULTISPECIES: hypothetical protein [Niastella]|uniref:Lipoprotein n=1 Tax=Niastella soli TaxID=2821487 RepID=A0ABS3Z014_9BACT|nr:hypothetical protein [Niastella soli]MBO9203513.1 hypothetical protein [Niastella soli]
MKSLISKVLIPILFILQACSHAKNLQSEYAKVPLEHLLDSIGNYQNKKIEIRGYYVCGAEYTSVQPELQSFSDNKLYDWTGRIWVEDKRSKSMIYCDSMSNRTVLIRGTVDSSRHGRLGEYPATIRRAVIEVQ